MNRSIRVCRVLLVSLALVAVATPCRAAEDEVAPASATEPMVDSPWFHVGWPKVEMPEFSWKPWGASEPTEETAPRENPVSQALDRVAGASKNAAAGVRNAWGSAMNKFSSFGSGPKDTDVAKTDSPGFFSRFFASSPEPKAPGSAAEYLAQERQATTVK